MGVKLFWLVVKDGKRKLISIEGKTYDDREFTNRVFCLQQKGCLISCNTPEVSNATTKDYIISEYKKMGFDYIEDSILDFYESQNLLDIIPE